MKKTFFIILLMTISVLSYAEKKTPRKIVAAAFSDTLPENVDTLSVTSTKKNKNEKSRTTVLEVISDSAMNAKYAALSQQYVDKSLEVAEKDKEIALLKQQLEQQAHVQDEIKRKSAELQQSIEEVLNKSIEEKNQEISKLTQERDSACAAKKIAENKLDSLRNSYQSESFAKMVLMMPLVQAYNESVVNDALKTVDILDLKTNQRKWYDIYYPMLSNYQQYNDEVAACIQKTLLAFKDPASLNRKNEQVRFEENLSETRYMKDKGRLHEWQRVIYLDKTIEAVKELFENDSSFKRENFEAQHKKLKK